MRLCLTPLRQSAVVTAVLLGCLAPDAPAAPEMLPASVQQFFSAHCVKCHDAVDPKGKVNLDIDRVELEGKDQAHLLEQIHRVLSRDEMPPKKKTRPPATDRAAVVAWLDATLTQGPASPGVALRRLTRLEFAKTIQSGLGIPFQIPPGFPEDSRAHGFDNVAETLALSPPLIEAYTEAAVNLADQIFPLPQDPLPPSEKFSIAALDLSSADGYGPKSLLVDGKMRLVFRNFSTTTSKFGAKASGKYRVRFKASAFAPDTNEPVRVRSKGVEFVIPPSGISEHEFTTALHPGDGLDFVFVNAPFATVDANFPYAGIRDDLVRFYTKKPRFLAAWLPLHEEVPDKNDASIRLKPFVSASYEIRKKTIQRAFEEQFDDPNLDLTPATPENARRLIDAMMVDKNPMGVGGNEMHFYIIPLVWKMYAEGPGVDIHSVEVEGPLEPVEHPRYGRSRGLQSALLGTTAAKIATPKQIEDGLQRMLTKVFRRRPSDSELSRYRALIESHGDSGNSMEACFHLALRSALVSPQFLYRGGSGGPLPAHEIASRLSYLFTLRPPDEPLMRAAESGELATSEALRQQAERLLGTKYSDEFIENFTAQWLGTRLIPEIMPDPSLGSFTTNHQRSFIKEPELLFAEILRENRPLRDFIDPDFTHTHASVGRQMYGLDMPPPNGKQPFTMTRMGLEKGGRYGGVLGMAGVMMATANGVDTQPVLRGKWFLENILGDEPPPPPESVPALTPDTRGAKTIRDLMRAHTSEESCARCHEKIDPYGFAFENFDAIGQWRERYPVAGNRNKDAWPAVDSKSVLADGTELGGITDLKKHLLSDLRPFARCLTLKLFIYASGRVPAYRERKELDALADENLKAGRGFRDLLMDVITSRAFLDR
jgi:hypothetical protein